MSVPPRARCKPARNLASYNTLIGALTMIVWENEEIGLEAGQLHVYTSLIRACVHEGDIQELLLRT
jgi:hypothetical protein